MGAPAMTTIDWMRAPVVIGATGGSGTRALRKALVRAGVYMGANTNNEGDAMDFEPLLDQMINRAMTHGGGLDYQVEDLPAALWERYRRTFHQLLEWYLLDRPPGNSPWGWKNPRSMYLLPLHARLFPQLRFIHMLRDGRDMALSTNINQALKHGVAVLGPEQGGLDDKRLVSASLWCAANQQVSDWGSRHLGDRYRLVRFEDLCADPAGTLAELLGWLGLDPAAALPAAKAIHAPSSLGRWRDAEPGLLAELQARTGPALTRFGYA